MVLGEVVTTPRCNDIQIVTASRPYFARGYQGTEEGVIGIVHLVNSEDSLEATLVKSPVVSHQWESCNPGFYLCPYLGEHASLLGVLLGKPMYAGTLVGIVFGFGLDERVVAVHYLTISNNYYAY